MFKFLRMQRSFNCLSSSIQNYVPQFHFMFLEILIPYSRIPRIHKIDLQDFSAHVLFKIFKIWDFQDFDISQKNMFEKVSGFSLNYLKHSGVSKDKSYWFWESWSRPLGPKTMNMEGFRVFGRWDRKTISPKWSTINLRSFRANLFLKFTVEMTPRPTRPQKRFFSRFSRIFCGNLNS